MKKLFPYILIVLIVVQLLAPFTVGVGVKNNLEVRSSKAEAAVEYYYIKTYTLYQTQTPSGKFTGGNTDADNLAKCNTDRAIVIPGYTNGPCQPVTVADTAMKVDPNNDPTDTNLSCTIIPKFRPGACIAQGLYWLFFKTTSAVFGLAGKVLDFTLMYSIQDSSYRSAFVVEGWGLVRDFCNMFFIFILLYIAFRTILNLQGAKTKDMIINVVIIGLLINFSLFATQVIIDASNILARVFYNPQTIVIGTQKDADGNTISELGDFKEIKLSEAIVSKVDPQDLIINSQKVNEIPVKEILGGDVPETTGKGITVGSFILIIFLSTAVNVVGIIAFLSCAIIFISRVIGLWLAMILAPLAFFSYTIPALQDMKMIGWKRWWPETLKLAFLAPVFAFFMYLIVGFMDKGLGVFEASTKTGLSFVVAIVVPFVFIMILLMKAKDIAKDMSGEMGQSITKGISAVGGVALGGAALGTALLGRRVIGQTMAKASRSDSSIYLATQKIAHNKKLEEWENSGRKGAKPEFVVPKHGYTIKKDKDGKDIKYNRINPFTHIGAALNVAQRKAQETDFARHTTDEAVDKAGFKGKTMNELGAEQQERVKTIFVRDNKSKWAQEEEDQYKKELGKSDRDKLAPAEVTELRNRVIARAEKEFATEVEKAAKGVNAFARVLSKANTGSWDVRKLSSVTSDKRASVFSKIPVALIGAIAMGVRGGLKSVGTSHGSIKVEGNFMKDLGNTISDSLKGMKINVNLEHVGETKSSADAHGGGAHH